MFVQTVLEEIKLKAEYPPFRFLFMLVGVGFAALLATSMRDFSIWQLSSLTWAFLPLALILLGRLTLGAGMSGKNAPPLAFSSVINKRRT